MPTMPRLRTNNNIIEESTHGESMSLEFEVQGKGKNI